MEETSTKTDADGTTLFAGKAWFDPAANASRFGEIEAGIRDRVRGFIEELLEQELTAALGRTRHERAEGKPSGYRNGTRERQLLGSFGPVEISVPQARMTAEGGGTQEWRSASLPRYARMTRQVEALVAGAYLSGIDTRRVKRALAALFGGAVGKDVVSRTWRKVLLAVKNIGGESEAAWRGILDDLTARGLKTPEFLVTDGGAGLERALAALWPDVPAQRCTVHKHRNLLAHAPDALHEEVSADYTDMIYAATTKEVQTRRKAFLRKWRLRCPAVATSLEEAGDRLFVFLRLPPSQWKSARTTNAIERLHEEFKRRIKTQTVLPSAETASMLFWTLLASGPAKREAFARDHQAQGERMANLGREAYCPRPR